MPPPIPPRRSPGPAGSGRRGGPGLLGEPGGQVGRGTIRGFPPSPAQPDPVYPPGQFSTWNRPSARAAWLGKPAGGPDDAEPGYSQLAVSDPSADATSTQTWAAIEDDPAAGSWSPRTGRDEQRGGHRSVAGPAAAAAAAAVAGRVVSGEVLPPPGAGPGGAPGDYAKARGRAGQDERADGGRRRREPGHTGPMAARAAGTALEEGGAAEGGPDGGASRIARSRRGAGSSPAAARRQGGSGRSHRQLLLIALGVALLVVLGGAYFMLSSGQAPARPKAASPPRPTATPSASGPSAPPGPWKFIQSRADDPQPLGLTELFPRQYTANGQSAALTASKASKNCAAAVLGSSLENAVGKAHCTQVLRATYLTSDHQLMGTIGVLNLVDVAAAEKVGKATGASEFIDPLVGSGGPTRNIKKGTGIEEAEVKGHYLILIWAEFSNLHSPSSAARRQQLEEFATGLINGTANVSLTSRMVTGKPH